MQYFALMGGPSLWRTTIRQGIPRPAMPTVAPRSRFQLQPRRSAYDFSAMSSSGMTIGLPLSELHQRLVKDGIGHRGGQFNGPMLTLNELVRAVDQGKELELLWHGW